MNERSFDQLLDAWMDLGPTAAPHRVADAARLEARTTRQTAIPPWWPPRRFLDMNSIVRVGLVAAALVAAALIGYSYFTAPNVGGPNSSSQPDETHHSGAPIDAGLPVLAQQDGPLDPGTYLVDEVEPLRLAITVPAGWTRNIAPDTVWTQNSTVRIWWGRIDNLYADPCEAAGDLMDPPLGPTVEDLVDALSSYDGIAADVRDVAVSGFAGRYIELTVADPTSQLCGADTALWRIAGAGDEPEGVDLGLSGLFGTLGVWAFDVNGDRLVLATDTRAAAERADVEGLESIMSSLEIQAP